jgi:hypothetical protein
MSKWIMVDKLFYREVVSKRSLLYVNDQGDIIHNTIAQLDTLLYTFRSSVHNDLEK